MPLILETVVSTRDGDDGTHLAPLGLHRDGRRLLVKPFRPSRTLDNLQCHGCAVANRPDDVRVYAGCLTGRRDWPLTSAEVVPCARLRDCLSHAELEVVSFADDPLRPTFTCRVVHEEAHAPFAGHNRAQAAVIELAILASRLDRLPAGQLRREVEHLQAAVDKTAGEREREAWEWLMERVAAHPSWRGAAA